MPAIDPGRPEAPDLAGDAEFRARFTREAKAISALNHPHICGLYDIGRESPNPENPPLYLDLPTKAGEPQPEVLARWAANAPLAFVDQYIGNLRRCRAISMDVGDQDRLRDDAGKLHDVFEPLRARW